MLNSMTRVSVFALLLVGAGVQAFGQVTAPTQNGPAGGVADSIEAQRREIMESDRWRRTTRGLNEWLSVQQLYSPDEVAVLRSQFRARVARMSPTELKNHLDDMEAKLEVLSSPEAEDARRWMSQFLAVQAKYTDAQLRAKRPDVANMSARQIRQELENFQARRGVARQGQTAVSQARATQVQSAQSRRQAQTTVQPSRAATIGNQNPALQRDLPGHTDPNSLDRSFYSVGPWGHPFRWDPLGPW